MVISTVNQVVYNGDGINTAWPYTFRIIEATDIKLLLIDADGTETDITADYYVDTVNNTVYYPGYAPGAEPPLEDQPPKVQTGQKLVVYRELPITQEKDLGEKWPFFVIELGLDKLTMILQQIFGWWNRSFKISEGTQATHPDFDLNVPIEAGKTFRVNDAGTGFEVTDDPKEAREAAEAAQAAAEDAAEAAEQALEDTRQFAVEPVYYYFNPQNLALENPDATAHMNECHIIKINDKVIMIDTGGWGWTTATKDYLDEIGVTKVDYLIISHYHGDHAGGLKFMDYLDWSSCIAYLPPVPTQETDSANIDYYYNECVTFLAAQGAVIKTPTEGDVLTVDDVLKITMLNCDATAFAEIYTAQAARIALDSSSYDYYYNDYSLVAVVKHRNTTVVYSSDIMQVAQERMLSNAFYQNIDVYKMHHHGVNLYGSVNYANSLNPDIVTVQNAQTWIDSYLNGHPLQTDTQYFLPAKTILFPFNNVAVLMSNGQEVVVIDGADVYTQKYKDHLSLSANVDRILPGSDLNDYTQGTYSLPAGTTVTSCINAPANWTYGNARLIAFNNTGNILAGQGFSVQYLISASNNGVVFMRTRSGSTWSAWNRIVFDAAGNTSIYFNPQGHLYYYSNEGIRLAANTDTSNGAVLILDTSSQGGKVRLSATNGNDTSILTLYPDSTLFLDGVKISPYKPGDTVSVSAFGGAGYLTSSNTVVAITVPLNKQISTDVTSASITGTVTVKQNNADLGTNVSVTNSTVSVTPSGVYLEIYKDAGHSSWGGTDESPVGIYFNNLVVTFA